MSPLTSISNDPGDDPGKNRGDDIGKPTLASPRTRITQACDRCRAARSKCQPSGQGNACQMCFRLGIDCVFSGTGRKRGPPKGYLKLIESRLYEAEAIIGILQSLPNAGVQSVLRDMGRDPLAGRVLERIAHTAFGPFGRGQHQEDEEVRDSDDDTEGGSREAGPSNAWQDQLIETLQDRQPVGEDNDIESEDDQDQPHELQRYPSTAPSAHPVSYVRGPHPLSSSRAT